MAAENTQRWDNLVQWRKYVERLAQRVEETKSPNNGQPSVQVEQNIPTQQTDTYRRRGKQRKPPLTKEELLKRLLDPILTLQETAIILGVSPATVRRYANEKGERRLNCLRTRGQQRRFRLSDVLAFEEQLRQNARRGGRHSKASSHRPRPQPPQPNATAPVVRPPIRFSD
ncbi:MAG: helix-turn-helix domain-containing protein [Abditibacteriales bacterium]|nr:helix-turn-helix domain-containing protein [Abditibacteriales bacterium]MDW8368078.1 helix-turn-helix domain-containing protein [Abditibacteriales bacterium]